MLPDLIDVGEKDSLLPAGIHPATLGDVQKRFVDGDPQYQRRVDLWNAYLQFRTMLAGLVPIRREYLDGSFVTSRAAPKDTDASFWIDAADLDGLTGPQQAAFNQLWAERMSRYHCDAYLITPCAPSHPLHATYLYWKTKTEESWPCYKNRAKVVVPGVVKGYVEVVQ